MGFAYVQPSSYIPFLARRARSIPTSILEPQEHRRETNSRVTTAAAAAHRDHDSHLQQQQCGHQRSRQRHRCALFSLGAAITGEDTDPRLGRRRIDRDDNGRNWGEMRFTAMMQLPTQVAAKVDVSRVVQELRDEGAEFNLRTYRGCLAFLAKGGRAQEALKYLQQMEVRLKCRVSVIIPHHDTLLIVEVGFCGWGAVHALRTGYHLLNKQEVLHLLPYVPVCIWYAAAAGGSSDVFPSVSYRITTV